MTRGVLLALAVTLASQSTLQQVVVGVPPAAAWGARTQTFSIEGRVGSGPWQPLKASTKRTSSS